MMRSLHEVQHQLVIVFYSGASAVNWPGWAGHLRVRRPRAASCKRSARPTVRRDQCACGALRKTRAPLRQQGCSPLESHRGLKHEGIL